MRTMEEIRDELKRHRLEVVAAEAGMSYNTVRNYAAGRVRRPRPLYLRALNDWLDRQETEASAAA